MSLHLFSMAAQQNLSSIYVDGNGVMRYANTKEEASFFGVNYTVPFAHAYRALGYLNKDRKGAIDRDVYHFARLGFNAYRIHVWDVEISDGKGNLSENDHLDHLDYLIYKLKERNIKIVITAMTNFGNGYPERNQPTGGFSYDYGKCEIHDNQEAIAAQEKYISDLVKHINPYTRTAYMNDSDIVGFEINNEPCHAGTQEQIRMYINRMLKALKNAGNKKPVFYNVSHNMDQIESYYSTAIQGTTFQWYPIGLVAGRTRRGNFLPYVDCYDIPFSHVKGFVNKAKLVYEYDPADITYSYMHPAMARSFRSAGFQWITQFAYDPMDMAQYNTEYQTHFLNLAYTPQKALSMKIAAEVTRTVPMYKQYESFPNDTLFEDFRVSYALDLSELNRADKFYYSNHTATQPVAPEKLLSVAGYGTSPVVDYEGTGAYFLDRLEEGVWRLEIMPDVVQVDDPFAKPSLKREVAVIMWNRWDMRISLPRLGNDFTVSLLNVSENMPVEVSGNEIRSITPGVYMLKRKDYKPTQIWNENTKWNNIRLGEYVAPAAHAAHYQVYHKQKKISEKGKPLTVQADIAGPQSPDSVLIYTDNISFWNTNNTHYTMNRKQGYTYEAVIPGTVMNKDVIRYNIVICHSGKKYTYPDGKEAGPLDWDYSPANYWTTEIVPPQSMIQLFVAMDEWSGLDSYCTPEGGKIRREIIQKSLIEEKTVRFTFESHDKYSRFFLHKYIGDEINGRYGRLGECKEICLHLKNATHDFRIGFVTRNGMTYTDTVQVSKEGVVRVPIARLQQTETVLLPHPFPGFLKRYFVADVKMPFCIQDIEKLEISMNGAKEEASGIEFGSVWLE